MVPEPVVGWSDTLAAMGSTLARPFYRVVGSVLTLAPVSRFHGLVYRRVAGRGIAGHALGVEIALLTTTGRRSGLPRTTPLIAVADGDRRVVVGTNGGRRQTPGWVLNLRARPHATLQLGPVTTVVTAHEADPAEAARLWPIVEATYPGYALYRERRPEAPLFVLHPWEIR
jgi:F420H(2)-dependent quinone reductase